MRLQKFNASTLFIYAMQDDLLSIINYRCEINFFCGNMKKLTDKIWFMVIQMWMDMFWYGHLSKFRPYSPIPHFFNL